MAVYLQLHAQKLCIQKHAFSPLIICIRNRRKKRYYPDWFLEPFADEETYEKLKNENKLKEMNLTPVKPAHARLTMSIFRDRIVDKFINMSMESSTRLALSRKLIYETLANIKRIQLKKYHAASEEEKKDVEINPRVILKQAVENCKPVMQLSAVKRGGITYQVPVPTTYGRAEFMSMKWLITAARDKDGPTSYITQLSRELLDAYHNEGRVIRRKQDLHKVCEANKAYAHYQNVKSK